MKIKWLKHQCQMSMVLQGLRHLAMKSRGSNESCLVAALSPPLALHDPTSCPHGDQQPPSARKSGFGKGCTKEKGEEKCYLPQQASLLQSLCSFRAGWVCPRMSWRCGWMLAVHRGPAGIMQDDGPWGNAPLVSGEAGGIHWYLKLNQCAACKKWSFALNINVNLAYDNLNLI